MVRLIEIKAHIQKLAGSNHQQSGISGKPTQNLKRKHSHCSSNQNSGKYCIEHGYIEDNFPAFSKSANRDTSLYRRTDQIVYKLFKCICQLSLGVKDFQLSSYARVMACTKTVKLPPLFAFQLEDISLICLLSVENTQNVPLKLHNAERNTAELNRR